MKKKNRFFLILGLSQIILLIMLGLFFLIFRKDLSILNGFKIIYMSITGVFIVLVLMDFTNVVFVKKRINKTIFKLEANDKYMYFYRLQPFMLILFGIMGTSNRNTFTISTGLVVIFLGLFIMGRGLIFPMGISKDGLLFFGEVYSWTNINKCYIDTNSNRVEFMVSVPFLNNMSEKKIELKTVYVNINHIIDFLSGKDVVVESNRTIE